MVLFEKLVLVFGSKTKAQEILLLINDAKEVVRHGFYDEELFRVEQFCKKNDLTMVKSNFKVVSITDDDTENYSNKGIRIKDSDPRQGMRFVYISKSEEKAWMASYFETMNNNKGLGLLLGYPSCCIEYFCNNFKPANTNPQLNPTNIYTNLSKRHRDLVIISHFPCKSSCEKSIALGKKYLEIIKKNSPERAQELMEKLKLYSAPPIINKL